MQTQVELPYGLTTVSGKPGLRITVVRTVVGKEVASISHTVYYPGELYTLLRKLGVKRTAGQAERDFGRHTTKTYTVEI